VCRCQLAICSRSDYPAWSLRVRYSRDTFPAHMSLQVLSLDGLPFQSIRCDGPVSGVCADDENVCTTTLEGDHAITLWRVQAPRPH
jgi:hypothetical protein